MFDVDESLPRLTTAQVATRLGVKSETVYAYVSRGILSSSRPAGAHRGSTFDPLEVEALARRTRRPATPAVNAIGAGSPLMVIDTALTLIDTDELFYRGVDASWLAANASFETAATWLLSSQWDPDVSLPVPSDQAVERTMKRGWRGRVGLVDRLRIAVALASSADPLRDDLTPSTVVPMGLSLVAEMTAALTDRDLRQPMPMATRLWLALSPEPAEAVDLHAINAALVLLLDHDLAASTLTARVAASARANPYAVIAAGLAGLDGVLHGATSGRAHAMLGAVIDGARPSEVVGQILRAGLPIPGFGHKIYQTRDPRAVTLMTMLASGRRYREATQAAEAINQLVSRRTGLFGNVDLALAVMTTGASMAGEAGEAVFALARSVGWIAHALEEYQSPPLRLRPSGRYVGPPAGMSIEDD